MAVESSPENNEVGLPSLPPRNPEAHKGSCGKVLIVACSLGMTGAGLLAARAALRAGAGLVTLAAPRSLLPHLSGALGSAMGLPLPDDATVHEGVVEGGALTAAAAEALLEAAATRDVVAIGPGIGRAEGTGDLVAAAVRGCERPLVVDADALWHLAQRPMLARDLAWRAAPTVVTPHPGEAASLLGCAVPTIEADRPAAARALAEQLRAVAVLKGAGTLIDDGARAWRNPTGNPGMATGGTGDVLTGVIAALLAQGMNALDAARLGVYTHGLAGDLAARRTGWHGLVAGDVVQALPEALVALGSPTESRESAR